MRTKKPTFTEKAIAIRNFELQSRCLEIYRRLRAGDTGLLSPLAIMGIMEASSFERIREIVDSVEAGSAILNTDYYTNVAQGLIKEQRQEK